MPRLMWRAQNVTSDVNISETSTDILVLHISSWKKFVFDSIPDNATFIGHKEVSGQTVGGWTWIFMSDAVGVYILEVWYDFQLIYS